jgi:heat shock protein HspQ
MSAHEAKFRIGQVVRHLRFDYVGVIFDIDPVFSGTEEWYRAVARSRPPRDKPWYHVLVDGAEHTTYVAERHLAAAEPPQPIEHELVDYLFGGFDGEVYRPRQTVN